MSAADRWEQAAEAWVELVRSGGDAPFAWNSEAFLDALPEPVRLTVDVGCGEGRIARALAAAGRRVVGVDASATLVRHAQAADPAGDYRVANASALPLESGAADLVVSFMALHDIERPYAREATVERALGAATITQFHRPLEWYADALAACGLRIDRLREIPTRRRAPDWAPMFLHVHASR